MTRVDVFSGRAGVSQPPVRPAARSGARRIGKAAALVIGLGLALGLACSIVPAPSPASTDPAPAAEAWTDIVRPIPLYALVGTEFAKTPTSYSARRRGDGERRDLLRFGTVGDTPFLELSFDRRMHADEPAPALTADLDAIDPTTRVSLARLSTPTILETRFGRFEAADLRLVTDRQSLPCIGFRNTPDQSDVLRIAGVVCGSAARPVGRDLLACVIDRIDLVSAGSDAALKRVFVDAERRRGNGCAPAPVVAAGTAKVTWLDATATPPPLKGPLPDSRKR